MFRAVATAALVLGVVWMNSVMAGEQAAGAQPAQPEAEAQATQRARETLAKHLGVAEDAVTVTRVEPRTWSDSSMGCGKPGTAALTVITEGYAVSASAQGREHEVHVSGPSAIVCGGSEGEGVIRREPHRAARGLGLDVMMEQARQDLAKRLGVEASTIRLAGLEPQRWPDSGLDCPRAGEAVQPGPVDGYRLALKHASRTYTYHTDRKTVRPCPAIESK